MSHFRRVQDTLGTADYLAKALDGDYQEDKYAHLRNTSVERKEVIAKNKRDFRTASKEPHAWEREVKPALYQDRYFPSAEDQYLDEDVYEDTSYASDPRAIRRLAAASDQPLSARALETQLKAFSPEDYTQALLKGASIFNPDFEEIQEAFRASQDKLENQFDNKEAADIRRAYAHKAWETEKQKEFRPQGSRGNRILRTGTENLAAGDFSTIIWSAVDDEREENKLRMKENKRIASAGIKRKGQSREAQQRMWEQSVKLKAQTFDDYYGDDGDFDMDVLIIK